MLNTYKSLSSSYYEISRTRNGLERIALSFRREASQFSVRRLTARINKQLIRKLIRYYDAFGSTSSLSTKSLVDDQLRASLRPSVAHYRNHSFRHPNIMRDVSRGCRPHSTVGHCMRAIVSNYTLLSLSTSHYRARRKRVASPSRRKVTRNYDASIFLPRSVTAAPLGAD